MKIAVLRERSEGETRVAATPETVTKLIGLGAEVAVEAGAGALARFPDAVEFKVFRAMTCYNLGRNKEGMETLLGILATTTTDPALLPYRRAMALYAEDLDRRW